MNAALSWRETLCKTFQAQSLHPPYQSFDQEKRNPDLILFLLKQLVWFFPLMIHLLQSQLMSSFQVMEVYTVLRNRNNHFYVEHAKFKVNL